MIVARASMLIVAEVRPAKENISGLSKNKKRLKYAFKAFLLFDMIISGELGFRTYSLYA